MKKIILPIIVALVAALTIYNTFTLGRVRTTTVDSSILQPVENDFPVKPAPPTQRLVEFANYDYSADLFIGNKLHIDPIVAVSNLKLPADIGDIWFDAVHSQLRMRDGNSSGGVQFAFAKYGTETVTIRATANDTVDFSNLLNDHATVNYRMTVDTVNGTTASISFEDTYNADSTYTNINSSIFPYTLSEGQTTIINNSIFKYNRVVLAIGDADTLSMTIVRDFDLGQ